MERISVEAGGRPIEIEIEQVLPVVSWAGLRLPMMEGLEGPACGCRVLRMYRLAPSAPGGSHGPPGARGLSPGGLPSGLGHQVRGRAGKVLGVLLLLLGVLMMLPFVWRLWRLLP